LRWAFNRLASCFFWSIWSCFILHQGRIVRLASVSVDLVNLVTMLFYSCRCCFSHGH
jgi:hypothetical protein